MDLVAYRKKHGLTQEQVAIALGFTGKSYISQLETGAVAMPLKLALQIEQWSQGQVLATELLTGEEAELLTSALQRQAAEDAA